ncbi:MAG: ArsC family reductase [Methylotenera sp.]|jgi:Spx/MgsR family transcriptional regulator|nr:ArsC family reductase [Methylotenera sp.]PKO51417.1 MAG: ArsC family reductase [Betaproteobacteria bacterium HGW-Betaproteobacteria-20]
MQLFGIPNCSTVKKARDWLTNNSVAYEFHDFKKNGVSRSLLENWLKQMPWEKLVNRAGMTWRNLPDADKSAVIDATSAINLMLEKTSVIKRPVLVKDGKIVCLGFTEAAYKELLP